MNNAYTNPKISFTPLPFPFYQAPDSSLSKHPLLPETQAPRPNTLYIYRVASDLGSFYKYCFINLFRNSLTLWYYHFQCDTTNLETELRFAQGHKVDLWKIFSPLCFYSLPFRFPSPAPCPYINISQNPKPLQPYGKADSLDPLHDSRFLLFPSRCSRSLIADAFPNAHFDMWIGKALKRNYRGRCGPRKTKVSRGPAWPLQWGTTPKTFDPRLGFPTWNLRSQWHLRDIGRARTSREWTAAAIFSHNAPPPAFPLTTATRQGQK